MTWRIRGVQRYSVCVCVCLKIVAWDRSMTSTLIPEHSAHPPWPGVAPDLRRVPCLRRVVERGGSRPELMLLLRPNGELPCCCW